MRNLIIFGDTSFAERLYQIIFLEGKDKVIAFTQEKEFLSKNTIRGLPVIPFENLVNYTKESFEIIIAVGYSKLNKLREKIFYLCKEKGFKVATYISLHAIVYSSDISLGCFISPGVIIGPGCSIGFGNFFECSVVLSHDNIIGNFNFFSTNTVLGGFSSILNYCFLGLHSTIKDNINISSSTLLGASTNVLKSIECENCIYVGNPAKILLNKNASDIFM